MAGQVIADALGDGVGDHVDDHVLQVAALQHALALRVEGAPLIVHDLVVFQQVLADVEVALLDLLLRLLDGLGNALVLDGHAVFHAQPVEQFEQRRPGEHAHQVVIQRQEEAAGAGVALAAGSAAELVVDPPRLVPLRADDVQAAGHILFGSSCGRAWGNRHQA